MRGPSGHPPTNCITNAGLVLSRNTVVVTYLKPTYNVRTLVARLRTMAARGQMIIGDVNCCGQRKSRALSEWLQNNECSEVAAIAVTDQWKDHECSINTILTGNGTRAIAMEDK